MGVRWSEVERGKEDEESREREGRKWREKEKGSVVTVLYNYISCRFSLLQLLSCKPFLE